MEQISILVSGRVNIEIMATEPVNCFLFHNNGLEVEDTRVLGEGEKEISINRTFLYPENQYWVVELAVGHPPGNYSIEMTFSGSLEKGMSGFYRSVYKDSRGREHPLATTHFEPTGARKAFPCLDEPSFKSTFSVTVVRPSANYNAFSNMQVREEREDAPRQGQTIEQM